LVRLRELVTGKESAPLEAVHRAFREDQEDFKKEAFAAGDKDLVRRPGTGTVFGLLPQWRRQEDELVNFVLNEVNRNQMVDARHGDNWYCQVLNRFFGGQIAEI